MLVLRLLLAMMTCLSLNRTSSFSLRGRMPGSVQAVRKSTDKTKTKSSAPTIGMAIDSFLYKYGQLFYFFKNSL
jgi:hypothetical protein